MVTAETFRKIAISFPEVTESAHFQKTAFKVRQKIFATLDVTTLQACMKLSTKDQDIFTLIDASVIYPVPNKWGKSGWTFIQLNLIKKRLLLDALAAAYIATAPAKLAGWQSTKSVEP